MTTSSLELWMLSEASRLLLKLKSTDEYCYILFSAFNKFAEEPNSGDVYGLSEFILRKGDTYHAVDTITIDKFISSGCEVKY